MNTTPGDLIFALIIKLTVCQHEENFFGCGIRGELTCGNIQAGNHIGAAIRSQAAQGAGNKINVVLVSNGLLLYNGSSVIDIGKLDHREVEGNALFLQFGDHVVDADGIKGEVQSINVLRQLVKVIVEINNEKEIREYKVEDLKFKSRRRREKLDISDEELRQLEVLDKREGKSKLDDD